MKFSFYKMIVLLLMMISLLLPVLLSNKIVEKKVFMEIETEGNFGMIEEDIIYKIKEDSMVKKFQDFKKKIIVIKKFVPNYQKC